MRTSQSLCALILVSALSACSSGDGFRSGTTTNKSANKAADATKTGQTGKNEDTNGGDAADPSVDAPADSGEDVQIENTETDVTQDPAIGEDSADEPETPPAKPVVIDKPEEFENLGAAEIIVVRRLPDPANNFSYFYYAENDELRPRGINIATGPAMDPNFTIYPKTVGGLSYHTAIATPGDARWNAYLAGRQKAISDFFRAIDAKGLATFNASQCSQFENSNYVSSAPESAPPQSAQLAVFLKLPRNGIKTTYVLRETGGNGCGSLNQSKFDVAVTHLLQRVESVVNAGHYWKGSDTVGMKLPPCPAEYSTVCSL